MMTWNKNTDCCRWNGVACNDLTGDVIAIDLTCGMLQGIIHPNTTLFHLPRLQRLNLAYNDFSSSQHVLHGIGRLSNTLTHLNISGSMFVGEIPSDILLLSKLISLDLSNNIGLDFLLMQPYVLNSLLQNSTHLRELLIGFVYISWVLPTHLNISSSLRLLDLRETGLQGKLPHNIFNLQYLQRLVLSGNPGITGPLPKVTVNQSSLRFLDLSYSGLQGTFPVSILQNLQYLEYLDLSVSNISGPLPEFTTTTNFHPLSIGHLKSLKLLDISVNNLSGKIPSWIGHLKSLKYLALSYNNLWGEIPSSIGHLKSLKYLDLSRHNLSGEIPSSIGHLKSLERLDLSYNDFWGEIPSSIGHLKSLRYLDLSRSNFLSGEIPYSIGNLTSLKDLDLSFCGLVGSLPKSLANLRQLHTLKLERNMLNGTLPSSLFSLRFLEKINLRGNKFSGGLPSMLFNCPKLLSVWLSDNQFDGEVNRGFTRPSFIQNLELSGNNFVGLWVLETLLSSLPHLYLLDLSYSGLSIVTNNATTNLNSSLHILRLASCKLSVFPESLRSMEYLETLDLSRNNIEGPIPNWVVEIGGNLLKYLDLSHNSITSLPRFQWVGLVYLILESNQIEGPFPQSICNMSNLQLLDLSDNRFTGVIPRCVGNFSSVLWKLAMSNNHFRGTIPSMCDNGDNGKLDGIILNGNHLEGEVPICLSKCRSLEILHLGNNHLNGMFPGWLGNLPLLQVLILRSNNFHGPVETSSTTFESSFPNLRLLDLSQNGFIGHLPQKYFQSFNAMKNAVRKSSKPNYFGVGVFGISVSYYYFITVMVKGQPLAFPKFPSDYNIIDLSNNKFEGEIPNVIGTLQSLIVLNLSHNHLTGRIPDALGNLSEIESLDLSCNQLIGEIPQSLADITNLEVLNLSQNHLEGRIPNGKQFLTFDENSFGGNSRLCGFPLPKCDHPQLEDEDDGDEEDSGFTWKVVMLGFGCGTLLGLVMACIMLSTGRPKWFNDIADSVEYMVTTRRNKRRIIYIGR